MSDSGELPTIETGLTPDEVVVRLDKASRRGRLPGFSKEGEGLFRAEAYATPFDHTLVCDAERAGDTTRLSFRAVMLRKVPLIFVVVLVLTLWPGLPLTDSMLATYSDWYASNVETWWWYVPMFVLSIPWAWGLVGKSRRAAHESAQKTVETIRKELGVAGGNTESA